MSCLNKWKKERKRERIKKNKEQVYITNRGKKKGNEMKMKGTFQFLFICLISFLIAFSICLYTVKEKVL